MASPSCSLCQTISTETPVHADRTNGLLFCLRCSGEHCSVEKGPSTKIVERSLCDYPKLGATYETFSTIFLRKDAFIGSLLLCQLPAGSLVLVLEVDNDRARVRSMLRSVEGWLSPLSLTGRPMLLTPSVQGPLAMGAALDAEKATRRKGLIPEHSGACCDATRSNGNSSEQDSESTIMQRSTSKHIIVHGPGPWCGWYFLDEKQKVNNYPSWRRSPLLPNFTIYSGAKTGYWFLGGEEEEMLQYRCDTGLVAEPFPHGSQLPYQATKCWMRNDDLRGWVDDPEVRFTLTPPVTPKSLLLTAPGVGYGIFDLVPESNLNGFPYWKKDGVAIWLFGSGEGRWLFGDLNAGTGVIMSADYHCGWMPNQVPTWCRLDELERWIEDEAITVNVDGFVRPARLLLQGSTIFSGVFVHSDESHGFVSWRSLGGVSAIFSSPKSHCWETRFWFGGGQDLALLPPSWGDARTSQKHFGAMPHMMVDWEQFLDDGTTTAREQRFKVLADAVPSALRVEIEDELWGGVYEEEPGLHSRKFPVWRRQGHSDYLFCSFSGHWMFGGQEEWQKGFMCDSGYAKSSHAHLGVMPDEIGSANWLVFLRKTGTWVSCRVDITRTQVSVPAVLLVQSSFRKGRGQYSLVSDHKPNGLPLWRSEDGLYFIFSGSSGQWSVGEEAKGGKYTGFISSTWSARGIMPDRIEGSDWMRFNGITWVVDASMRIVGYRPGVSDFCADLEHLTISDQTATEGQYWSVGIASPRDVSDDVLHESLSCQTYGDSDLVSKEKARNLFVEPLGTKPVVGMDATMAIRAASCNVARAFQEVALKDDVGCQVMVLRQCRHNNTQAMLARAGGGDAWSEARLHDELQLEENALSIRERALRENLYEVELEEAVLTARSEASMDNIRKLVCCLKRRNHIASGNITEGPELSFQSALQEEVAAAATSRMNLLEAKVEAAQATRALQQAKLYYSVLPARLEVPLLRELDEAVRKVEDSDRVSQEAGHKLQLALRRAASGRVFRADSNWKEHLTSEAETLQTNIDEVHCERAFCKLKLTASSCRRSPS